MIQLSSSVLLSPPNSVNVRPDTQRQNPVTRSVDQLTPHTHTNRQSRAEQRHKYNNIVVIKILNKISLCNYPPSSPFSFFLSACVCVSLLTACVQKQERGEQGIIIRGRRLNERIRTVEQKIINTRKCQLSTINKGPPRSTLFLSLATLTQTHLQFRPTV